MSKSIRLHPKYGLNPTVSVCILCGKDTGELVLLGAAYEGEAPMHMVTGVEPCADCKAKYLTNGVMLVEAEQDNRTPTGSVAVLTDEAFTRIFNVPVPGGKIALVERSVLEKIGVKVTS